MYKRQVQLGSKALSNLGLTYQHLFWSVILNEGYAIVIPDHEGPDSAFGCLLYTSDAADEEDSVDLVGRRIIKKKKK